MSFMVSEKEADNIFNEYENEPDDWKEEPPAQIMKNQNEVFNILMRPATHMSTTIIKGLDPNTGRERTGYGYSGFDEANNSDLTTSYLSDDVYMATSYVNYANVLLTDLKSIKELYGINVKPTYQRVLHQRSMYLSLAKSVGGRLMNALTTQRSEQTMSRKIQEQNKQNKGSWFNINKKSDNEEASYE